MNKDFKIFLRIIICIIALIGGIYGVIPYLLSGSSTELCIAGFGLFCGLIFFLYYAVKNWFFKKFNEKE